MELVNTLEKLLGQKALLDLQPMQPGDVETTFADVSELQNATGFSPKTTLQDGLGKFVDWFNNYYAIELSKSEI
jgi:UDP-glucuronate 4-epimerase